MDTIWKNNVKEKINIIYRINPDNLIQQTINTLYRHPRSLHGKINAFGGYSAYWKMLRNRKKMVRTSLQLKPVYSYDEGLRIYFLTGKKYLYQTLFCITSLTKCSNEKFKFILIDDGSFNDDFVRTVNRLLPNARIYLCNEIKENIRQILPEDNFKHIWAKREEYVHIRKLTDIHTLPDQGWKLVLDSDMLFWDNPKEIINWLKDPKSPLYMVDCEQSYGYSQQLMEELTGTKLPKLLNVGVFGLNSNMINWNEVETWISILEEKEGKSYFLEQALSAMIVAKQKCSILNNQSYIVNPSEHHVLKNKGFLHHYVELSKKTYFNHAWKKLM